MPVALFLVAQLVGGWVLGVAWGCCGVMVLEEPEMGIMGEGTTEEDNSFRCREDREVVQEIIFPTEILLQVQAAEVVAL